MTIPGRGELVGRAYVQILADAKALDGEIEKYLALQGKKFDKAADEDGERYARRFREQLRQGDYGGALGQVLKRASGNVEASGKSLGDKFNAAFIAKMTGKNLRIGEILEKDIRDNFDPDEMFSKNAAQKLERFLRTRLVAAEKQFTEETRKATLQFREQEDLGRKLEGHMSFLANDFRRRQTEAENAALLRQKQIRDTIFQESVARSMTERNIALAAVRDIMAARDREITQHRESTERGIELDRVMTAAGIDYRRRITLAQDRAYDSYASNIARSATLVRQHAAGLNRIESALTRVNTASRNASVSNPFPRSRWLRPIGGIISLATKIPEILSDIALNAFKAGRSVFTAFSTGGPIAGLKAAAPLLATAAAGFSTLGVAAVAFIFIAGPLVAAISGVVGVLVALAGSVTIGLIGALGAFLPLVLALAAGAGALALAFTGNNDALKDAVKPFRDWADAARAPVKEALFANLTADLAKFNPVLEALTPLLTASAGGLSRAFTGIADAFTSSGFISNIALLQDPSTGVPALLEKLGSAIGLFGSGLVGFITAILPTSQLLLDNIVDVAERFDAFANSDTGKSKIAEFFDRAWQSAQELGKVVGAAYDVVAKTFLSGQDTGDSLLGSITDSLERFSDFVADGGLVDWFKDARQFATDLGPAVDGIADAFKALNTDESQKRLGDFFELIGKLGGYAETAVKWIDRIANAFIFFVKYINPVTAPLYLLYEAFQALSSIDWGGIVSGIKDGFIGALTSAWDGVKSFFSGLWQGLVDAVKGILGIASPSKVFLEIGQAIAQGALDGLQALGGLLLDLLKLAFSTAWDFVKNLFSTDTLVFIAGIPGQIIGALLSLAGDLLGAIGGAFSSAWTGVSDYFTNTFLPFVGGIAASVVSGLFELPGKVLDAILNPFTSAWTSVENWWNNTALPFIKGIPQAAADALIGLAGKIAGKFEEAYNEAKKWADKIKNLVTGQVNVEDILGPLPAGATSDRSSGGRMRGGWVTQPGWYGGAPIGERGLKEVVIPMELPISQVDPSVRWMAELIRGNSWGPQKGRATGGVVGGGSGVTFEEGSVTILAPQTDPAAAGMHMLNELTAKM